LHIDLMCMNTSHTGLFSYGQWYIIYWFFSFSLVCVYLLYTRTHISLLYLTIRSFFVVLLSPLFSSLLCCWCLWINRTHVHIQNLQQQEDVTSNLLLLDNCDFHSCHRRKTLFDYKFISCLFTPTEILFFLSLSCLYFYLSSSLGTYSHVLYLICSSTSFVCAFLSSSFFLSLSQSFWSDI